MTGAAPKYQPYEDEIIAQHYPDYVRIRELLPHRSFGALKARATNLGVAIHRRPWTAPASGKLAKMRAEGATWRQIQVAFPDRSLEAIKKHAYEQGMPLNRRFARTGDEAIDAIRTRARALGMTFTELDAQIGLVNAFASGTTEVAVSRIEAAVRLLGGEVRIVWDDPD